MFRNLSKSTTFKAHSILMWPGRTSLTIIANIMVSKEHSAASDLRRMAKWIVFVGVLMVAAALAYIWAMDAWSLHAVVATILGVFVSVILGCGLFALAFFSNKSGHDDDVSAARSACPAKGDDAPD